MPRKKNKRKANQEAKAAAERAQKPRVAVIAHRPDGLSGATMALAVAAAFPSLLGDDVLGSRDDTRED